MVTFYPLITPFTLIAILNQNDGVLYTKNFKKNAHTRMVTIISSTIEKALNRLNLKSPVFEYIKMINNPHSKIIKSPDELRRVKTKLISFVFNTAVCITYNSVKKIKR